MKHVSIITHAPLTICTKAISSNCILFLVTKDLGSSLIMFTAKKACYIVFLLQILFLGKPINMDTNTKVEEKAAIPL